MQKLPACPLHCTLSPCKRLTLTSSNRRASMKLDRKLSTMQGIASISASTIGEFMIDQNDYNRRVIEEFRADRGKPGGRWEGRPLLLLTTTGARSGDGRCHGRFGAAAVVEQDSGVVPLFHRAPGENIPADPGDCPGTTSRLKTRPHDGKLHSKRAFFTRNYQ